MLCFDEMEVHGSTHGNFIWPSNQKHLCLMIWSSLQQEAGVWEYRLIWTEKWEIIFQLCA